MMTSKSITLVLGGARAGKSGYAQALASQSDEVVFLATAQASDEEMCAKIARHRQERPSAWKTVEVPFDLDLAVLEQGASSSFLIIDCLTTYTANQLVVKQASCETILHNIDAVCNALLSCRASTALISNEVGSGIVPEFPAGRVYRDILGEVNQRVARICDNVVLMVAGYPLAIKGNAEVPS
jgi:adenosylcobinamide kinase / adenosylcobinamide-phosphate guanylyltransferase